MNIFKKMKPFNDTKHKYKTIAQLDNMTALEIININPKDIGYYLLDPAITNESIPLKKLALQELRTIKNDPSNRERIIRTFMRLIQTQEQAIEIQEQAREIQEQARETREQARETQKLARETQKLARKTQKLARETEEEEEEEILKAAEEERISDYDEEEYILKAAEDLSRMSKVSKMPKMPKIEKLYIPFLEFDYPIAPSHDVVSLIRLQQIKPPTTRIITQQYKNKLLLDLIKTEEINPFKYKPRTEHVFYPQINTLFECINIIFNNLKEKVITTNYTFTEEDELFYDFLLKLRRFVIGILNKYIDGVLFNVNDPILIRQNLNYLSDNSTNFSLNYPTFIDSCMKAKFKAPDPYFNLLKDTLINIEIRPTKKLKEYEKQKLKDNLILSNNNLFYFISCITLLKKITTLHLTRGGKRKSNKNKRSTKNKSSNKRSSNKRKSNKRKSNKLSI
jgi:hypothetical protein